MTASHAAATPTYVLHDREFAFLVKLAYARTGIVLGEQKRAMVYGRLVRRLRALRLDNFAQYCALLETAEGQDEIAELINSLTTNLTRFFREEHHFEHLAEALGDLVKEKKRVRLWSAACSSGMEPYSMAMVMQHILRQRPEVDAKILATDIDSNILAVAANGVYPLADVKTTPKAYQNYIQPLDDGRCEMSETLKASIAFKSLNLLGDWPMKGPFDMVFCRNVVIYFDKPTKVKLFDRIANVMSPRGWLYIGHSENLHDVTDRFELIGRTIYRKVK